MGHRITTVLIDDLTGATSDAEQIETVGFALDGIDYEIDLTEPNATALRDGLVRYINAGRRAASDRSRSRQPARTNGHRTTLAPSWDSKAAREWARKQGLKVPQRGRLPGHIQRAYREHLAQI
jgi:hypothetical protein